MANEILKNRPPYGHISEAVNFAFSYRSKLFRVFKVIPYKPEYAPFTIIPAQIPYEILAFLKILTKLRPQRILEIGTERGGTLFLWTYVAAKNATIISIDISPGCFLFGYSYPYWKEDLYRSFSFFNQKIYPIRGFSQQPSTLRKVMDILATGKLDFLFIDGDHTYEGVRKDFEIYSPLVRKGGIIAFHDIVPGPPERVGGVPTFWNEIKQNFTYNEIVKDWQQGGCGIGVIYV
ncbi:MAG: class I SAM-dependent methyltransferase [Sulfolobales archaeon]